MDSKVIRIRGQEFSISRADILAVATREAPRKVNSYYVEIDGRRFPPKQLLRSAIATDLPFDTAVATRALQMLGFEVVNVAD